MRRVLWDNPGWQPMPGAVWPRCLGLMVALLMLGNSSCTWRQSETARTGSFKPHAGRHIGQDEVGTFLSSRVGLLISTDQFPADKWLAGDLQIPGGNGFGCAAAIDPRSYFLTAAHCLRHKQAYVVFSDLGTNGTTLRVLRTRVVWQGNLRKGEPDLALLQVQRRQGRTFAWAEDVYKDEPVMAVGLSWTNRPKRDLRGFALMGGTILDCSQRKEEPGGWKVANDVPLQPGDSGGPLVHAEAHLVGINVKGTPPFLHWILPKGTLPMVTERPNRKWLLDLIEADVAARLTASTALREFVGGTSSLTVASARLSQDDQFPKGFYLRRIKGTLWLRGYWASADNLWDPDDHLVFCKPAPEGCDLTNAR